MNKHKEGSQVVNCSEDFNCKEIRRRLWIGHTASDTLTVSDEC